MTFGWRTLDVGEKALIYNKDGSARIEEGPQRIFLHRDKFSRMERLFASQKQYLKIKYKNGTIEHSKGPSTAYLNPMVHDDITVEDLISLDANEALVVYAQEDETKNVERRIQCGPTLFMIKENEWLHTFSWHGTEEANKTKMVQDRNKFSRLKIIPDQFYYNVDEVRTKDDALMRVKLMIFYELTNIEKMLKSTKDPIADFINCLSADVIAFAAQRTYEEFIETATELNHSKTYQQLMERCQEIGYNVSKVVFRGYFAHDKLQNMHDTMIEKRTRLQMEFEEEVQQQEMLDKKAQREFDQMEQEHAMELNQVIHQQKMARQAQTHKLELEKQSHEKKMDQLKKASEAKLKAKVALDKVEADYLTKLHDLDINVTSVLINKSGRPEKVTRILADEKAAHIFLHHNEQMNNSNVRPTLLD